MSGGRKPDFIIKALDKDTQERGPIGAMWDNGDGSFGIKLNTFMSVPNGRDLAITAWPADDEELPHGGRRGRRAHDDADESQVREEATRRTRRLRGSSRRK